MLPLNSFDPHITPLPWLEAFSGLVPLTMQITVAINAPLQPGQEDILFLEVAEHTTVASLKNNIEFQAGYPIAKQVLFYNNAPLADDTKTMQQCQIAPDSMLGLRIESTQTASAGSSRSTRPQTGQTQGSRETRQDVDGPERLRLQTLANPGSLAQLSYQSPELANAVRDPAQWREVYLRFQREIRDREAEKQREIAALEADPFNVEAQRRMEELIRLENVEKNFQDTQEYHPEAFGRVHMLYIDVEVNGNKVKAFVDSGAQATIMSPNCAENCGIMRLLDKRFAGMARGAGTAKILGKVHSAQIKIGSSFLPCAFTVMEGKDVDLQLGLDMLKSYQACIDLQKGALIIQGDEMPFLGEADLPKKNLDEEPTVDGPSGTKIGGISGVVTQPGTGKTSEGSVSQQGPTASQQPLSTTGPASFPPEDITKLTDMGFSREEAIQALSISGGDVDAAAGMLL